MEAKPVEMRAGIGLAPGRYIAVADDVGNRIAAADSFGKRRQHLVLHRHEPSLVAAFQFDADREIVAALPAAPNRRARVPGPAITGHELNQLAVTANQEMRRHAKMGNSGEIGMAGRIKPVRKQCLDGRPAESAWRQADRMNDDQFDRDARWTLVAVG